MRSLAWVLLGIVSCACGSDQGDLDEARDRWKKTGIEHYELFASECSWSECTGELHVVVDENGVSAERTFPKPNDTMIEPEDFTVDNGMLTPTLKVKRKVIREKYEAVIDALYT